MNTKIDGGLPAKPVETPLIKESAQARAGAVNAQTASVDATPPVDSLSLTGEAVGLKSMAKDMAGSSKVDVARVKELRAAIESGTYQINPQDIANRLLALERQLLR